MLISRVEIVKQKWDLLKSSTFTNSILPKYLRENTLDIFKLSNNIIYCLVFKINLYSGGEKYSLHKVHKVSKIHSSSTMFTGYQYNILDDNRSPRYIKWDNYKKNHWMLEEKHYNILKEYWSTYLGS